MAGRKETEDQATDSHFKLKQDPQACEGQTSIKTRFYAVLVHLVKNL